MNSEVYLGSVGYAFARSRAGNIFSVALNESFAADGKLCSDFKTVHFFGNGYGSNKEVSRIVCGIPDVAALDFSLEIFHFISVSEEHSSGVFPNGDIFFAKYTVFFQLLVHIVKNPRF